MSAEDTAVDPAIAELNATGDYWVPTALEHRWSVQAHHTELERDRVGVGDAQLYRSEYTGEWFKVGWSDASKARVRRDYPLSFLVREGARALAEEPRRPLTTDPEYGGL